MTQRGRDVDALMAFLPDANDGHLGAAFDGRDIGQAPGSGCRRRRPARMHGPSPWSRGGAAARPIYAWQLAMTLPRNCSMMGSISPSFQNSKTSGAAAANPRRRALRYADENYSCGSSPFCCSWESCGLAESFKTLGVVNSVQFLPDLDILQVIQKILGRADKRACPPSSAARIGRPRCASGIWRSKPSCTAARHFVPALGTEPPMTTISGSSRFVMPAMASPRGDAGGHDNLCAPQARLGCTAGDLGTIDMVARDLSIARLDAAPRRHQLKWPAPPHTHGIPTACEQAICPISPAKPWLPRTKRPWAITAPPMPVPAAIIMQVSALLAAPPSVPRRAHGPARR